MILSSAESGTLKPQAIINLLAVSYPHMKMSSAKNTQGDFSGFRDFMRRLVTAPHCEIKAKLDAEKIAKKRKAKPSTSRDSGAKILDSHSAR
jgi:hypothetical protein